MAYRVYPDGTVEADTLKEILALQKRMQEPTPPARVFRVEFEGKGEPPTEFIEDLRRRGVNVQVFIFDDYQRPTAGNWWRFTSE